MKVKKLQMTPKQMRLDLTETICWLVTHDQQTLASLQMQSTYSLQKSKPILPAATAIEQEGLLAFTDFLPKHHKLIFLFTRTAFFLSSIQPLRTYRLLPV